MYIGFLALLALVVLIGFGLTVFVTFLLLGLWLGGPTSEEMFEGIEDKI